jgi:hypothetical protein
MVTRSVAASLSVDVFVLLLVHLEMHCRRRRGRAAWMRSRQHGHVYTSCRAAATKDSRSEQVRYSSSPATLVFRTRLTCAHLICAQGRCVPPFARRVLLPARVGASHQYSATSSGCKEATICSCRLPLVVSHRSFGIHQRKGKAPLPPLERYGRQRRSLVLVSLQCIHCYSLYYNDIPLNNSAAPDFGWLRLWLRLWLEVWAQ